MFFLLIVAALLAIPLKVDAKLRSSLKTSKFQLRLTQKIADFEISCFDSCLDLSESKLKEIMFLSESYFDSFQFKFSNNSEVCENYSSLGLINEDGLDGIVIINPGSHQEISYHECFDSESSSIIGVISQDNLFMLNFLIKVISSNSKFSQVNIRVLIFKELSSILISDSVKPWRSLVGYASCSLSCKLCFKSCLSCSDTECNICDQGFFLSNGLCYDCVWPCLDCLDGVFCKTCYQNYYFLDSGRCLSCSKGCLKCSNFDICTECETGEYFLNAGRCFKCSAGCASCSSQNFCSSCYGNFFYLDSGLCISCQDDDSCKNCQIKSSCSTCANPFYALSGSCLSCASGCSKCDSSGGCLECENGLYLDSGKCFKCESNCLICAGLDTCTTCSNLFYQLGGKCFECAANCIMCNNLLTCTDCSPYYFLNSGQCFRCPDNCWSCSSQASCDFCNTEYYIDSGNCLKCSENCAFCKNANTCYLCNVNYFEDSGKCTKCSKNCKICQNKDFCVECEDQHYLNLGKCLKCLPNCITCKSPDLCSSCKPSYLLSNGLCMKCTSNCKKCIDQLICVACNESSFLALGKCLNCPTGCKFCESDKKCFECYENYYLEGGRCLKCLSDCKICRDSGICKECEDSFYLENGICLECNSNCEICQSQTFCIRCKERFYISASECLKCSSNCLSCHSSTLCIFCDSGYFVSDGQCTACPESCWACSKIDYCLSCKISYFFEDGNCINCSPNCLFCYDLSRCIACEEGFNLVEGWCFRQIPECEIYENNTYCSACWNGFFLDSGECISCSSQCLECSNLGTCLECRVSQYLNNGLCLDCPLNCLICINFSFCSECLKTFYEESGECFSCPDNCESCYNSSYCLYCSPTFYLDSGKCVKCLPDCPSCLSQTYCHSCLPSFFSNSGQCSECPSNCLSCRNPVNCQKCNDGYFLNEWKCETCDIRCGVCLNENFCSACAQGYYRDCVNCANKDFLIEECKTCHPDCLSCDNGRTCLVCKDDSLIPSDNPGCGCLPGFYRIDLKGDSFCSMCMIQCLSCENKASCTECKDSFVSIQDNCLCPESTYFDGVKCRDCYQGCKKCKSSISCEECLIGDTYPDTFCVCKYEIIDNICRCSENYFLHRAKCVPCERWLKKEDFEILIIDDFSKIIIRINSTLTFSKSFRISDHIINKFIILGVDFSETRGKEKNEFHLILGTRNFIFYQNLTFLTNNLKSEDKECEYFMIPSLNFQLIEESKRPTPVAKIDTDDIFYYKPGINEKLNVSGTQSTGGYSNPLLCTWTLTPIFLFQIKSNCLIEIELINIFENIIIQINLKVETYFGTVDYSNKNVSIHTSQKIDIGLISVTSCIPSKICEVGIESIQLYSKSKNFQCEWRETGNDNKSIGNSSLCSSLVIEPFTYSPGIYNFSLVIKSYGVEISQSIVEVVMIVEKPVIIVDKMNGTVTSLQDLEIDASESFDPNNINNKYDLLFEWTCQLDSQPCKFELKNNSSILYISSYNLHSKNTYEITLKVISRIYNSSEIFKLSGNLIEENVPVVKIIEKTTKSYIKKIPLMEITILECLFQNSVPIRSLSWSINHLSQEIISDSNIMLSPSSLGLPPGTYTLTVEVLTEKNTKVQYLSEFEVNSPPKPGTFSYSPFIIQELVTEVSLKAENWEDPDLPLEYMFISQSPFSSYILISSKFSSFYSTFSWTGQNQTIICRVFDSLGDFSELSEAIHVQKSSFSQIWNFFEKNRKVEPISRIPQIISNIIASTLEREFFESGTFQGKSDELEKFQEIFDWSLGYIDEFLQLSGFSDLMASQVINLMEHLTANPALKTNFSDDEGLTSENYQKTSDVLKELIEKAQDLGLSKEMTGRILEILANIIRIDQNLLSYNQGIIGEFSQINDDAVKLAMKRMNANESTFFENEIFNSRIFVGNSIQFEGYYEKTDNLSVSLPDQIFNSDDDIFKYGISTSHYLSDPLGNSSSDLVSLSIFNLTSNEKITVQLKDYLIEIEIPIKFHENDFKTKDCLFLNETLKNWSTKGCIKKKVLKNSVICTCNHLTTFYFGVFELETSATYSFKEHASGGLNEKTLTSAGFLIVISLSGMFLITLLYITIKGTNNARIKPVTYSRVYPIKQSGDTGEISYANLGEENKNDPGRNFPRPHLRSKMERFFRWYCQSIFVYKIYRTKKDIFIQITKHYFIFILQIFLDILIYDYQYRKKSPEDFENILKNNLTSFNIVVILITEAIITVFELLINLIERLKDNRSHEYCKVCISVIMLVFYIIASIYCFYIISKISTAFNSVINKAWIICIIVSFIVNIFLVDVFIIKPLKKLVKFILTKARCISKTDEDRNN